MTTVLLRGGGDLATGVAWRLWRAGCAVVVCELPEPLTVRRRVALSSAVRDGTVDVEGMVGRRTSPDAALAVAARGEIPVVVSPTLPNLARDVVVDARLAKRNLDTTIADAELVVALGPGFTAGIDCHCVVETLRGPHLGRALWSGSASPNTGVPGELGGRSAERLLRAPAAGTVGWTVDIGDRVQEGATLGTVDGQPVTAGCSGVVRGLIAPGTVVTAGLKLGDVDPRATPGEADQISDKALSVGGGVLEAVTTWWARR